MHWLDFLFPPRVDERILRDVSIDDFLTLIAPQLISETRPETVALLPFSDPRVRAAIHEAKYHGSTHAFTLLAAILVEYLRDSDEKFRHSILVPVPLGTKRMKERGFNQVEEIAKRVAEQLGGALDATLLVRTRETPSQVSLPKKEREENMRGAFLATRRADSAHTYIIIDDVLTTGATLQAAVRALHDAGAVNIILLALAH